MGKYKLGALAQLKKTSAKASTNTPLICSAKAERVVADISH